MVSPGSTGIAGFLASLFLDAQGTGGGRPGDDWGRSLKADSVGQMLVLRDCGEVPTR